MKYIAKRLLAMLCAVALLCALVPTGVVFAVASADGFEYRIDNGTATITAYTGSARELTIPSSIDGYTVTTIGNSAFLFCTSLTNVVIPDGVTMICDYAFFNCTSLTSVAIPDSVTAIGSAAFDYCSSLKAVHITDLVAWCEIEFASSSANPLWDGQNLYLNGMLVTDLRIPDGVTTLGRFVFTGCDSLKSVVIPDSVTSIERYVFSNCTSLTSVVIPDSVTTIGKSAFNSTPLSNVYYSGDETQKEAIVIDTGNTSLTDATWNYNFVGIGESSEYTYYMYNDGTATITGYTGSATELTIPSTIDGYTVTKIGESAFFGCDSLTSVVIPDGVTEIGALAFRECRNLEIVTLPEGLEKIGIQAFCYCSSLESIAIPVSVTEIGMAAFADCTSMNAVYITDLTAWCGISFGQDAANPLDSAENLYLNGVLVTDLRIPDGVTAVGKYVFTGCDSLTSVVIPNSVTKIEQNAFSGCLSLTRVAIPDSVTKIGLGAFTNCQSLTNISIPNAVTTIEIAAFSRCDSLKSIVIPSGVTTIEMSAFSGCGSLQSITLPDSVTEIGYQAFIMCTSLETVYYSGNETQKEAIVIDSGNIPLTYATWYYNHVDDGGELGNLTDDDVVDIADATMLFRFVNGRVTLTAEQKAIADLTNDGVVDIADATKLFRFINGRIPTLE